jgi:hypothetical protein
MVFNSVTYSFELTEQKRQDDIGYLQVLRNIRNNQQSEADYNFLKQHCSLPRIESLDPGWLVETPVVVSLNDTRSKWNEMIARTFAKLHSRDLHVVVSKDSGTTIPTPLIKGRLNNDLPSYLQHSLFLCIGMPVVVVGQNLYKYLGVTNGSIGTLKNMFRDQTQGAIVALEIEMKVKNEFQIPGLSKNTIIVKRSEAVGRIQLSDKRQFEYKRLQFPIAEGFAITDYKCQGSTLPRAILSLQGGRGVSTYVKLSRTKSRAHTFLMDGFTLSDLSINPPAYYSTWRKTLEEQCKVTKNVVDGIIDFQ